MRAYRLAAGRGSSLQTGSARARPRNQRHSPLCLHPSSACYSASASQPSARDDTSPKSQKDQPAQNSAERDFFLSVLAASATKRDAKSYLARFRPADKPEKSKRAAVKTVVDGAWKQEQWNQSSGVNLGNLYAPTKAIGESPVFVQEPIQDQTKNRSAELVHVALVKLRAPQTWSEDTLSGVALTLSQLAALGLHSAIVVDCDEAYTPEKTEQLSRKWREDVTRQAERIVAAIGEHNPNGAILLDNALGVSALKQEVRSTVHVRGGVEIQYSKLLLDTLMRGLIPVIPPIAYTVDEQRATRVHPDDAVLALTREFAGITTQAANGSPANKPHETDMNTIRSLQNQISLDRVIVLDPLGGVPASDRPDNAHIFINLEQEYDDIRQELTKSADIVDDVVLSQGAEEAEQFSSLAASNPFSRFVEQEIVSLPHTASTEHKAVNVSNIRPPSRHLKNLDLIQRALALLPPSASAFLTTPDEAAISARPPASEPSSTGVRTRRQKNPLIHNLLTDKPMVSSSLPSSRLSSFSPSRTTTHATFLKKGMPLTIIPDPRQHPWTPPGPEGTTLSLDDPRIDFPRLLHLIEDSFNRPLDVQHYLSRIRNRLAGIIIAGEYEGGALLTWEVPPSHPSHPPVPYLDKFAVLKRSQGAGGVADVVFKAMVRSCFPKGVVWRSRQNNPVNKWYFERSVGTYKVPGTQWTMFWTTEGVEGRRGVWEDYVGVCRGVEPSWADKKAPD
ncbi:Amino-acid acetyltransferase, mitochondrial [Coniosporium apollinis]|uniref:Amino-acid acetyltransferase, mitochondrial n=1 Tax=Coniosporium apollinis TaxID=61459 RepID=A0ABQ9P5K9_9PEZI|nr:Amino-acid acetyltransferase, mitochondrial [Coniosporium apollinis]